MFRNLALKYGPKVAIVAAPVLGLVQSAHAALPAEATTLFTTVAADGALVIAASFTAGVGLIGGWIVFDMVKKGARKAAK